MPSSLLNQLIKKKLYLFIQHHVLHRQKKRGKTDDLFSGLVTSSFVLKACVVFDFTFFLKYTG